MESTGKASIQEHFMAQTVQTFALSVFSLITLIHKDEHVHTEINLKQSS